jgi:hypothetical protein
MSSGRNWQDVQRLTQQVASVKRHIDQIMAELAQASERIPDPAEFSRSLPPVPPDERRDLANSCIALRLALHDTSRLVREVTERTGPHHAPPGANAA